MEVKKMKTFRRYLLSYLCTLLLPVLVFSVVIYEVVVSYCGAQLLEQNMAALQQLSLSVSMQREQLDAFAVQTTNRSEFFYRNQTQPGDFYEIQRVLSRWMAGNAFIDDICYYNPKLDKIYAFDAVYSIDDFAYWRAQGFTPEEIRQILASSEFNRWSSVSGEDGNELFYFASARVSPQERNWLICRVSRSALDAMVENTRLFLEANTYICDVNGNILYSAEESCSADVNAYLALQDHKGIDQVDGESMIYARLNTRDLVFLSVVPEAVANRSIYRIWRMVYIGLLIILVLGAVVISGVMKLNYKPIRELENDVLQSNLIPERSADELQNVRLALELLQNNHSLAMSRTIILDKERMILRLLMGSYASVDQFNSDGLQAKMRLSASSWYIVNILLASSASACEDSLAQTVDIVRKMYADREDLLYLEMPENSRLLLIVSGQPRAQEREELLASIQACGFEASIVFSAVCSHVKELSDAWLDMSGKPFSQQSVYPKEIYDSLLNAIEFGESDRIRFAIETLIASVTRLKSEERIQRICSDVIELVRNRLPLTDADGLLAQVSTLNVQDGSRAEQILRRLCDLLCAQLEQVSSDASETLIQQIEQYLQAHYCEPEFTVQKAASHFNLSMSNLSHYFKSHTGVTVSDYVESLRLNLAQTLLTETDKSVSEISVLVGYLQPASFMRAFKRVLGVSPTSWRNAQRDA